MNLNKAKEKLTSMAIATQTAFLVAPITVFAAPQFDDVKVVTEDLDPINKMGSVIGMLLSIVRILGAVIAVYGGIEVAQGFMDDGQADKKSKGFKWIFGGIIMIGMKSLLQGIGIINAAVK